MVTSQRHKRHDDPYIFFLSQDSDYSQLTIPSIRSYQIEAQGQGAHHDHHTEPAIDVEPIDRPSTPRADGHRGAWAVLITGLALFMASLDNLVVTTALPVIRVHLHAGLSGLEWTVNAYTLTFAVLLLTAAAVGERFGRRRTFMTGVAIFTTASALAAIAPSIGFLIAARALQAPVAR